jgi:hypothetical protein
LIVYKYIFTKINTEIPLFFYHIYYGLNSNKRLYYNNNTTAVVLYNILIYLLD